MDPREKRRVLARTRPRLPSCCASGVVLLLVFCSPRGVSASTKTEGRRGCAVRVPEKEGKIASVCRFSPLPLLPHEHTPARLGHGISFGMPRLGSAGSTRHAARRAPSWRWWRWWRRCGVAAGPRRAASGSRKLGSARPGPRLRLLGYSAEATRRDATRTRSVSQSQSAAAAVNRASRHDPTDYARTTLRAARRCPAPAAGALLRGVHRPPDGCGLALPRPPTANQERNTVSQP